MVRARAWDGDAFVMDRDGNLAVLLIHNVALRMTAARPRTSQRVNTAL